MGRTVATSLAGLFGVGTLMIGTSVVNIMRAASRRRERSAGRLFFSDGWEVGLYLAFAGLLLLTGILWMVWQHRAHANLTALHRAARYRPGAVWWWIVPVASLFMPFLAIRELAQAGDDRPALRRWWWGTYVAWNTGAAVVATLPAISDVDVVASEIAAIVIGVIGLVAAFLAIQVVRVIDLALDTRRVTTGWATASRPRSNAPLFAWGAGVTLLAAAGGVALGLGLPAIERLGLETLEATSIDLDVGSCFNEAEGFPETDCDRPHSAEVFLVVDHPDQLRYPGERAIAEWAEPVCYARFETYTGVAYEQSPLDFGYLYPTPEGWVAGDREVVCYIFDPSGDLTAPIRTDSTA